MTGSVSVPNTFGSLTSSSTSALDANFTALVNYANDPTNRENIGTDTGTASAYVITTTPALAASTPGQVLVFTPANTNSGASTASSGAVSALSIVKVQGGGTSNIISGDIIAGVPAILVLGNSNWLLINPATSPGSGTFSNVAINGLFLSNDGTSPNTVLDIAAGGAVDTTATYYMKLAGATTKNVTASFVAGGGNGSLDTGTIAASTWYHVHLIYNHTTLAVDVLTSLSYSAPTLPSGYGYFVPIGAIYMNGSTHVMPFVQYENEFLYYSNVFADVNGSGSNSTAGFVNHTVPHGLKLHVLFYASIECSTGGNQSLATIFYCPDQSPSIAPAASYASLALTTPTATTYVANGSFSVRTNTSGQTVLQSNATLSASSIYVNTYGFVYQRGIQ